MTPRCTLLQLALLASLVPTATVARGQQPPAAQPPAAPAPRGYVVSDAVLQALAKRWAFELADGIDLDGQQEQQVREAIARRWVPFFKQHQEDVAPLIDRWMQAMIDPDAPAPQEVQAWAEGALQFQELLRQQLDGTEQDLSELLPSEKIGRLKGELAKVRLAMGLTAGQFARWKSGDFDKWIWERNQQRREERRRLSREHWLDQQQRESTELVTLPAWDEYVRHFIERFDLDAAQRASAQSVLSDIRQRAQSYLDAHREDIEQIRRQLLTDDLATKELAAARRGELAEPLHDLFSELQARLEQIPTEAQRARAAPDGPPAAQGKG